jgi:hypothetical protein
MFILHHSIFIVSWASPNATKTETGTHMIMKLHGINKRTARKAKIMIITIITMTMMMMISDIIYSA